MMPIKPKEPSLGGVPDYSRALYYDPPSHDFCIWLLTAELMRRYHRAPGPLRVKFLLIDGQLGMIDLGPGSLKAGQGHLSALPKAYSDTMIQNVLIPAISMLGAETEAPIAISSEGGAVFEENLVEYDHHIWPLVDAARAGHAIPQWEPPGWAQDEVDEFLRGERPVVLTLREETDKQPERNNRLDDWLRFAGDLELGGYPVLFVRDTAKADEPLAGYRFRTYPRASRNAYVRAALYQRARVNMSVHTGPVAWFLFGSVPYLLFNQLVPTLPTWSHGQAKGWKEQDHLEVGESYPWAFPKQRLTWVEDTYENLRAAFEGLNV